MLGPRRRSFLQTLLGAPAVLAAASAASRSPVWGAQAPTAEGATDALLDEIERRACAYFYEQADPDTGMVLDRANIKQNYAQGVSSIAATGFGLSAMCIADLRGYIDRKMIRERTLRTLQFLNNRAEHQRGFFYHFMDSVTGKRVWQSEASSIDTTWLLCGALHARAYFQDGEIRRLAGELLKRIDWKWMLNGRDLLSHGWTPEHGFLPYWWDSYAELLAMYLLAIGSEGNGIPKECWDSWKRPLRAFEGIFYIDAATPLFVHQYSHAWFDLRNRKDKYANYFNNSQRATQAHRQYCMSLASQFPWYGPDMWGVTASDSRGGYRVWGSPDSPPDGTLVPCAAGGSLVFLPKMCGTVLTTMMERYGPKVWCKYGFVDAFHPKEDWYSPDVIGIDLGIMMLMAENVRSAAVWTSVMSTPEAHRGMDLTGLREAG